MELKKVYQVYYGLDGETDEEKIENLDKEIEKLKKEYDIVVIKKGNNLYTETVNMIVVEPVNPRKPDEVK